MLHQIMYERVCRMLVEFKNYVGRGIRDLRVIFLSRFHCKCTWVSRAMTVKLMGEMKGWNPHKSGLSRENFSLWKFSWFAAACGGESHLCDWEGLSLCTPGPRHMWRG